MRLDPERCTTPAAAAGYIERMDSGAAIRISHDALAAIIRYDPPGSVRIRTARNLDQIGTKDTHIAWTVGRPAGLTYRDCQRSGMRIAYANPGPTDPSRSPY